MANRYGNREPCPAVKEYIFQITMKRILIYIIATLVAILSLVFVIVTYKDQIVEAIKWLAILTLVFGSGWVVGRYTKK